MSTTPEALSTLFTISDWRRAYAQGANPRELIMAFVAAVRADDPAWILRCDVNAIEQQVQQLEAMDRTTLPLWGVPFAVKDNIDVAGLATTAACPAFAYTPQRSATVVQRLLDAGAILVGKTNLDQFATGLVGTRSPYGEVPNTFDARYVSGGSSSGSASVVARGLVPFALGTDTAGSGRVPAGFNQLVGLKPTPGRMPMAGVLPACRTLDVVSIFALTVGDAAEVMALVEGPGDEPVFQRHALRPAWLGNGTSLPRVGIPVAPDCDAAMGYDQAFVDAVARARAMGCEVREIDMTPFHDVAHLLYEGPWVAERYAVVAEFMATQAQAMDPTVRGIIEAARDADARSAFEAQYRLETLRQATAAVWQNIDVLMVPTAPTCPTREAVTQAPVARNSELGRYTNFVNLLGMAAIAVPSTLASSGLPFGVTFIAPGGGDAALVHLGATWVRYGVQPALHPTLGHDLRAVQEADLSVARAPQSAPTLAIAVVGAHLQGMPLHGQLAQRGCRLLERTTTSACYQLYALPGTTPPKPGLARSEAGGQAIALEVYEMQLEHVGSFLALIPPPLGLGSVELADGRWVKGFICEPWALAGAEDISHHGGWRAYMTALSAGSQHGRNT